MIKKELEKANVICRDLDKLDSLRERDRFCVNGVHFETPMINQKIQTTIRECYHTLSREFKDL
jgi:hypothetical protein